MNIKIVNQVDEKESVAYLIDQAENLKGILTDNEYAYLLKKLEDKADTVTINRYNQLIVIVKLSNEISAKSKEEARIFGATICSLVNKEKLSSLSVAAKGISEELLSAFTEGILLSAYQFLKYKKSKETDTNSLITLQVEGLSQAQVDELLATKEAVYAARDMINEPVSYLNAEKLAETAKTLLDGTGATVEIFGKDKIIQEKMGGLLAVNRGSIDPPTFTIIEWKPDNATNTEPIALVGKGVVFDTGGLSLKPTPNSMDLMKSDMGGAAGVIGTMYAISKLKLPLHVIAFIPATDNRPDGNAYTPGDIVTMYDGTTVEIKNTDAEGRMILADAIAYANKYKPKLTVTMATLTGAAAVAIGEHGVVGMGDAGDDLMDKIQHAGQQVYERVALFPFWEEYGKAIKSDIADIKNLGDREGGAISAGKFLAHFCTNSFIHIDIAGPAFLMSTKSYRTAGGTGVGIRLLVQFLKSLV